MQLGQRLIASRFFTFHLTSEGVVELWLTSEDTGAYGRDIGVTLPELLWQLVEVIPDGAMLRIGMTNPPYILEHLEVCALFFAPYISHRKYIESPCMNAGIWITCQYSTQLCYPMLDLCYFLIAWAYVFFHSMVKNQLFHDIVGISLSFLFYGTFVIQHVYNVF